MYSNLLQSYLKHFSFLKSDIQICKSFLLVYINLKMMDQDQCGWLLQQIYHQDFQRKMSLQLHCLYRNPFLLLIHHILFHALSKIIPNMSCLLKFLLIQGVLILVLSFFECIFKVNNLKKL